MPAYREQLGSEASRLGVSSPLTAATSGNDGPVCLGDGAGDHIARRADFHPLSPHTRPSCPSMSTLATAAKTATRAQHHEGDAGIKAEQQWPRNIAEFLAMETLMFMEEHVARLVGRERVAAMDAELQQDALGPAAQMMGLTVGTGTAVDLNQQPQRLTHCNKTATAHPPLGSVLYSFLEVANGPWYSTKNHRFTVERAQMDPRREPDGYVDWTRQGGFQSAEDLDAYVVLRAGVGTASRSLFLLRWHAMRLQAQGEPWVPVIQYWTTVVALGLRAAGGVWTGVEAGPTVVSFAKSVAYTRTAINNTSNKTRRRNAKRKRGSRRGNGVTSAGAARLNERPLLYCPYHPGANSHDEESCWTAHPELRPSAQRKVQWEDADTSASVARLNERPCPHHPRARHSEAKCRLAHPELRRSAQHQVQREGADTSASAARPNERPLLYCPHHPGANSHNEESCWTTHPELRPSAHRKVQREDADASASAACLNTRSPPGSHHPDAHTHNDGDACPKTQPEACPSAQHQVQSADSGGVASAPRRDEFSFYCPHHPDSYTHNEESCWKTRKRSRPSTLRSRFASKGVL